MREDDDKGYKKQQLAAQREEDGFSRLGNALEEITSYHLEAYDGKQQTVVAHAHHGHLDHLLVRGEDACHIFGAELTDDEGQRGDNRGQCNGNLQHLGHAVVRLGAIVISSNGLHALGEAHHDHYEDKGHLMYNTISSYGIVTAIAQEATIYEDDYKARGEVHQTGRQTNGEHLLYDIALQVLDTTLEMYELALVAHDTHLPNKRDALRQYRSNGCSANAPAGSVKLYKTEVDSIEDK